MYNVFGDTKDTSVSNKMTLVLDLLPTAAAVIRNNSISYVNEEFCRLVVRNKSALTNGDIGLIGLGEADLKALINGTKGKKRKSYVEVDLIDGEGYSRRIHFNFMPFTEKEMSNGVVITAIDVTDNLNIQTKIEAHERRLESFTRIVEFEACDLKEALDYSLAEAIRLTDSMIGYFYYYNELTKKFKLNTWSKEVMPSCSVANKQTEYDLDATGCWGEAVRQRKPFILNDYSMDNPYVKGTPKGHVALKRFMTVPIFDKEEIVAVVGVANKIEPYNDNDIKQLSFLMTFAWKVLERLRYEQALVNSEKELQIIFDNSPNIMMVLDEAFCIKKINKKGMEFSGLGEEDIIGATPGRVFGCKALGTCTGECDYTNPVCGCAVKDSVKDTFMTGDSIIRKEDKLTITDTESEASLDIAVSTAIVKEKEKPHVLLAVDDVTEQKALQQQLNQSQKLQAIGQLAGGIAHDFNNVLAGIIGYAELMEQELVRIPENQKLKKYNKNIIDGSQRAKELIKQILTFSRRNREEFKLIGMAPIVQEVLELLEVTLPSSIRIHKDISSEQLVIKGNTTMIHELLINLINNANQAMAGRGNITIRLYRQVLNESLQGVVKTIPNGDYVVLEVEDDGEGIDPKIAEHIFEPFFTTKLGKGGTGMGLSVVYGIVQSHEGTIVLEDMEPHGALFKIYFKYESAEPYIFVDNLVADKMNKGNGEKIMLVDDEEIILSMMTEYLQELGYEVYSLNNSETAVQMLQEGKVEIDLIITDQTMPVISGIELASVANRNYSHVPVVLCSGDSYTAMDASKNLMNIAKYLSKPIRLKELSGIIRSLL